MRQPRVDYAGAFHHVMSRGNGKQNIFLSDNDRKAFLSILEEVISDCDWTCHSYCLMDNHYHLLLETPMGRLSEGMQLLNGIFGGKFNKAHDAVGHVMQGRYTSRLVKDDNHFLILLRYMALNPVKAYLVREPSEWRWSSYRALAGLSPSPPFLTCDLSLQYFATNKEDAHNAYADYIHGFLPEALSGSLGYCPSLEELLGAFDRSSRDRAVHEAYNDFGFSMTEIADFLGVNCSTISRIIKPNRKD